MGLDAAWRRLVDDAAQEANEIREQGRPAVVFHREPLDKLAKLSGEVKPRSAVEATLAMYLLPEFDPRRFWSDEAFKYQFVRRVRSPSDANVGVTYDHRARKTKRVYWDLRPRSTAALANMLIAAFGRASLYIARHERDRLEKQSAAQRELDKALTGLK